VRCNTGTDLGHSYYAPAEWVPRKKEQRRVDNTRIGEAERGKRVRGLEETVADLISGTNDKERR
jgi:hypothetical protein